MTHSIVHLNCGDDPIVRFDERTDHVLVLYELCMCPQNGLNVYFDNQSSHLNVPNNLLPSKLCLAKALLDPLVALNAVGLRIDELG